MDLSSSMILDMALNIAGYLAAGALSVIVYSALNNRRTETTAAPVLAANVPAVTPPRPSESRGSFVSLATPDPTPCQQKAAPAARPARTDRSDIHRIAREMIKAGASADKIQRVLPISEAELQLLTLKAN